MNRRQWLKSAILSAFIIMPDFGQRIPMSGLVMGPRERDIVRFFRQSGNTERQNRWLSQQNKGIS